MCSGLSNSSMTHNLPRPSSEYLPNNYISSTIQQLYPLKINSTNFTFYFLSTSCNSVKWCIVLISILIVWGIFTHVWILNMWPGLVLSTFDNPIVVQLKFPK